MPTSQIELRPATNDDCERVWKFNNTPEARAVSVVRGPIPLATHRRWFQRTMVEPATEIHIVEVAGRPAGVVRIERRDPPLAAAISIALGGEHRGAGVGRFAIHAACKGYTSRHAGALIEALIRNDNAASARCFEAAGFTARATIRAGKHAWNIYRWTGDLT